MRLILALTLGLPLCFAATAWTEDGLTATAVTVGQAAPLDGPAKGLGTGMNLGLQAAFAEANAAGGIGGRKIELVALNDGYDPDKCVEATGQLIEDKKVFNLIGYVGTPTAKVAIPIVQELKVPLVGLFTGTGLARKPELRYVVNVRASYDQETEVLVEHLVNDLGAKRIAVFFQNDAFGQAGLSGTEKALAKRSMTLAAKASFERNTVAVKAGLADLIAATPDAVVVVGPYKPVAAFAKEANTAGFKPALATVSFVGTNNLINEGGTEVEGMTIAQVVPSPGDPSLPVVKAYQEALAKVDPTAKPSYVSLEGYLTGKVWLHAFAAAGASPTRESLLDALEGMQKVDLGGFVINFDKGVRQGSQSVWLTQIKGGEAKQVGKLSPR